MAANRGKEWEGHFARICEQRGIDAVRFHDVMLNAKDVNNPADFIISLDQSLKSFLIECKETASTNWSLSFDQYDRLLKLTKFQSFVLIWFSNYKEIWAMSLQSITRLKEAGVKSFNPKRPMFKDREIDGICEIDSEFARIKPKDARIEKLWEMKKL